MEMHAPAVCPGIRPSRVSKNDPLSERFSLFWKISESYLCVILCLFCLFLLVVFGNPQKLFLKRRKKQQKQKKCRKTPPILFHSLKLLQKHRNALWGVPPHCQQHLPAASTPFLQGQNPWMPGENSCPIWGAVLDEKAPIWKSQWQHSVPMKSSSLEWTPTSLRSCCWIWWMVPS